MGFVHFGKGREPEGGNGGRGKETGRCFHSLQEKDIFSLIFLCSSGLMFIFENMFLDLKTNIHNLCTSAWPRNIRNGS
jgi:hypothetical protein